MNFNYINKFFIFVFCFLTFSCETIQELRSNNDVEYDKIINESYEDIDILDINISLNKKNNLDYFSNSFYGEFILENKINNKISIKNYNANYKGKNNIKIFIIDDLVYGIDSKANFNIYHLENGKLSNSVNLQNNYKDIKLIPTSFSKYYENFIIGFKSGLILMIDKKGELIWEFKYNDILSTPIKIIDDNIIIIFSDTIISLSIKNNKENWSAKYEGQKIIKSNGGIISQFANLIYFILPNSYVGEYDTLLGQKNISKFSDINFKNSLNNSEQNLHIYKNFLVYYDGQSKLSTYDIFSDEIILKNFNISNIHSYNFYNNSIIILRNNEIISFNVKNGKIFWSINAEKMIDNKNKIIKIQNFENILYVFFDNGKVLLIRDNDIYKVVDLKVKNIEFLYFQNNKLFASLDNGKTILY